MRIVLGVVGALALLAFIWIVVLPEAGMGVQWREFRKYEREHEKADDEKKGGS